MNRTRPTISRRSLLKGAAATAGVGAFTGFPAIVSAEPVTLRYLGTAVNQSREIAEQVKQHLGITIEYLPVTTDDVTRRVITQPNSFDIVDTEYFSLKKLVPSGNLLGMDAKRIKLADKIANLRDVVANPPPDWSHARRREYFDWAKQVIDGLRGDHPHLEEVFDAQFAERP